MKALRVDATVPPLGQRGNEFDTALSMAAAVLFIITTQTTAAERPTRRVVPTALANSITETSFELAGKFKKNTLARKVPIAGAEHKMHIVSGSNAAALFHANKDHFSSTISNFWLQSDADGMREFLMPEDDMMSG